MSSRLAALARALTHHWIRSLFAALAVLFAIGALAANGSRPFRTSRFPGADSDRAMQLFKEHTPPWPGGIAGGVHGEAGQDHGSGSPGRRRALARGHQPHQGRCGSSEPVRRGRAGVSPDGTIAQTTVRYTTKPEDLEKADGEALVKAAEQGNSASVSVALRGQIVDLADEQSVPVGEFIGIGIAIILLTLLFRSIVSMLAVLFGAILGIAFGQMLIAVLSKPLGLPSSPRRSRRCSVSAPASTTRCSSSVASGSRRRSATRSAMRPPRPRPRPAPRS